MLWMNNRVPTPSALDICDRLRRIRGQISADQLERFDRAISGDAERIARRFNLEMELPYLLSLR